MPEGQEGVPAEGAPGGGADTPRAPGGGAASPGVPGGGAIAGPAGPDMSRAVPLPYRPGALAIVRPRNLVLAAAGVAVGGFFALGSVAFPAGLLWAMASALGLGAAGNVANDLADVEADRINRPLRPLVTGAVSPGGALLLGGVAGGLGLWAAWWVSPALFGLGLAALAVMLVYSPLLKSRGLLGNLAVAVVASMPLVYGAAAVGDWRPGLIPAVLAAFLHLAREVVKDLEDVRGDAEIGRRTVPLAWGMEAGFVTAAAVLVTFVPVSLAPWLVGPYGWRYGVIVSALDVGVAWLIVRLMNWRLGGARAALKVAMAVGLAALVWELL
jgi:geranylgeranylglycerol-phosphate geranylgeranyltransferase